MSLPQPQPDQHSYVDQEVIRRHANNLSARLHAQRVRQNHPGIQKRLRKFTSGEVARMIGVADSYLRQLSIEGKGPPIEVAPNGRRLYSVEDINALRAFLDGADKARRQYVKHRSGSEHLQIISCVNFKGGSAKTTTTAHLAQYLALNGYRVLAVDLDPQASLTAIHGLQPELDVGENQTMYGAIRYAADACHPREVIQRTYFPGLDLIPANLELTEFETETPMHLRSHNRNTSVMFFERVGLALSAVSDDYDIVLIDCPPQLGFLTMSALSASTALVVTVHPQMLDVMSMSQFLKMTSEMLDVVQGAGGKVQYDWIRYLVTRYEPSDKPQTDMVDFLREMFQEHVLKNPVLKSTAISDAGITKQTLYEVPREDFSKGTYDRAMDSLNSVNAEIEELIKSAWGRV
ncbi:plasmid partitioning protein RepA [Microvirga subterranea]|uniref:Chromosome partitioning protein n=1 Tax=Microvirga subterranea TaxID=186651 RepID=A0A370H5Q8_9HYPH|nr:plasmid partitioning protein RepA [Microvirga subterranea]RDI51350.1 chromosome partitioning protein [Microvirga subterranea]